MKRETISEEMRVLYVALTRAKEKLIITGVSKDLKKQLSKKQELVDIEKNSQDIRIPVSLIKKCNSYLDWLQLISIYNKDKLKDVLEINEINANDVMKKTDIQEKKEELDIDSIAKEKFDVAVIKEINEKINWKYEYISATVIPSKTSVTKLKELAQEQTGGHKARPYNIERKTEIPIPEFLKPQTKLTGAKKGTIMHLCMQKLDLRREYTIDEIAEFVDKMVYDKIINMLEAESINKEQLLEFTKSDLAKRIRKAKTIYKEKPFYININAGELYGEELNEDILVQGIIDLYFIDENDKLVLVDYKTDRIEDIEELISKYKTQLDLYKQALEEALEREVDEVYIYSVYKGNSIDILK